MAFAGCDGWREEAAVDVAVDDVLTFQESVSVWIGRPNVINRRLTHAAITRRFDCDEDLQVSHLLEWVKEEKGWVESSERELLRFQVTVRRLVPREMIEETEELVEAIVQGLNNINHLLNRQYFYEPAHLYHFMVCPSVYLCVSLEDEKLVFVH